jgi:hypothetical protein
LTKSCTRVEDRIDTSLASADATARSLAWDSPAGPPGTSGPVGMGHAVSGPHDFLRRQLEIALEVQALPRVAMTRRRTR